MTVAQPGGYRSSMLQVRRATPADAEAIALVHVASWQWAYAGLLPADRLAALDTEQRAQRWRQVLTEPSDAMTLVGERDDRIVGFASVGPARGDDVAAGVGELWGLYVHPDVAGDGTGYRLHEAAMAWLREQGARSAVLWMLRGNTRAHAFYERQGWRLDGGEKVDERPDGFVLNEIRFSRPL